MQRNSPFADSKSSPPSRRDIPGSRGLARSFRKGGALLTAFFLFSASFGLAGCGSLIPSGNGGPQASRDVPQRSARTADRSNAPPSFAVSAESRACQAELSAASVNFTPLPNREFAGGCTQINAVAFRTINLSLANPGAGQLEVANLGAVTCPLARAFAGWAQYGVARAARQMLDTELVRIETYGSYNCRTVAGTRTLSQHAHANAIDVAAFVFEDGRRITLSDGWNGDRDERRFLRTVHDSACKRFGTVLSPEFNAAHRDHFHLEMSRNDYCR